MKGSSVAAVLTFFCLLLSLASILASGNTAIEKNGRENSQIFGAALFIVAICASVLNVVLLGFGS